jgi:hypothetical protein
MRYVIIRDDDTNAFTPVTCLEQLYRPFLDRGLPINLAVIPNVSTTATTPTGRPEGFLRSATPAQASTAPISGNPGLVKYLQENRGFHILQHGCHHDCFEFGRDSREELSRRLSEGTNCLLEAGFSQPETFVAPHDRLSQQAFLEVADRFQIVSTGWFELRRLPRSWWPRYTLKKFLRTPHWKVGRTLLLSHPGCLLSCHRPLETLREAIISELKLRGVTVLVTHWWEYFPNEGINQPLIELLHEIAEYLAHQPEIRVVRFRDLVEASIPLN